MVSDAESALQARPEVPGDHPPVVHDTTWAANLLPDSDDGIFLADEDGVVLEVNDAWTRIVGFGPEGVPYRAPYPWWPDTTEDPEAHAGLDAALTDLLGAGSGTYEVMLRHQQGHHVWVSISATSVPDPGSSRRLLVGTVRDVTGQRAVRRRQQLAVDLSQRLNEAAETDEVLGLLIDHLGEMFGAEVYLAVLDSEPIVQLRTVRGVVPASAVAAEVLAELTRPDTASPEAGPVCGLPARILTAARQWRVWIAFARERSVTGEEHLILGLAATAAGQALQRLETRDEQRQVTERLRSAVANATEQARVWQVEAAARADQIRAERRFRSLVEATNTVIWSRGPDGMVAQPQPSLAEFTGQPWPQHGATGWLTMVHPEDRERVARTLSEAVAAGTAVELRYRLWRADGAAYRHVVGRAAAIRDEHGDVVEWLGTITDVHGQTEAEEVARRTTAIIDAVLQQAPVGIGWADLDLRLRHVNPALAQINGLPSEEHLGRRPADLWEADGRRIEQLMRAAMADGPITGVEFIAPEPDTGLVRHRVASYFPIRIPGSAEEVGVGFTVVDVTERTRLLQALGEQRYRFERLVDTDVLAVFGGVDEAITEANDAFLTMLGYHRDDLEQGRLRWPGLTPPGWEAADRRSLDELATTGRASAFPKEYRHADGRRVPVLVGVVALDQAPLRWLAYAADLTAERAAQAESRLFQALVERTGDLIAVARADGSVRYVNPAGLWMTGRVDAPDRLTDLLGGPLSMPKADEGASGAVPAVRQRAVRILPGGRDEGPVEVDLQAFTVGGDSETNAFLAVVARDVTDRQRTLRQAEALARFAGALSTAADPAAVTAAVDTLLPTVIEGVSATWIPATPGSPVAGDDPVGATVFTIPVLIREGTPAGSVLVRWTRPIEVDGRLRSVLKTVADLIGQALQRTELITAASGMATLAARLSVTRTPDEAITVMLDTIPTALGTTMCGVLVREQGDRLRLHDRNLPDSLAANYTGLRLDDPRPIVETIRSGQRIVLPDRDAYRERYPHLSDVVAEHGIVSSVALPLHDSQGRTVAALGLGWRHPQQFGGADLTRLDTLADLCEQTLERTRLVATEHQLITRLATRLHPASAIVPDELDIAVRYRPALSGLELGGDWYDLINLPAGRFAVVIGDVVGHHIDAAADMAQLRTVINTLIRLEVPLEELFARFTALVGRGFWGTAVVLVLDPAQRRADIVRAGHPHPVLLGPGLRPTSVATDRTPPLGLVTRPVPVTSVPFEPGAVLLAYTDGLVERRDADYDDGIRDLHATLAGAPAGACADDLADAVLAAAIASEDDQALVVVRHDSPDHDSGTGLRIHFTAETITGLRGTVRAAAVSAGLPCDRAEDLTIAVYELLTNAVRHGGGRGQLRLRHTATVVECEIWDEGTAGTAIESRHGRPGLDSPGGRGLWLAGQLVDELRLLPTPSGGLVASLTMVLTEP
ncbi:PAS domain S-box protein [Actinoplanes philippinensis]|uniref:PAS domain S-box protein n=1 Tax=Actinoplanes philippinensis TaxID=35752 RepID=UPI00340BFBBF